MTKARYDKPSEVIAMDGAVLVDGPDGVDIAFVPEASRETGRRLIEQAAIADRQERDLAPPDDDSPG